MKKLTAEERRRIFQAQQAARQAMLERISAAPVAVPEPEPRGRRRLVASAIIAMLIGGGLLASGVVEFDPPTSIEALLPRL